MLKSDEILEKLEPDSKDVFVEGLIDMYINRSDEMKNVCLADFASLYNISKKKTGYTEIIENSDNEDIIDDEINDKNTALKMKDEKDLIRQKRSEYVHREANEFEQAFEEHMEREIENNIDDTNVEYDQDKNEFLIYEIGNNEGDIFVEMGLNTRTEKVEHFNAPKIIPDTEYQELMRSLNNNQRRYTLNVMNLIKKWR
ncbi:unnamed protein product [Rotaria sp. Silwood1]|nr:unnamed protein product [Rotaria sp. Silwood1]CAF1092142.1 unnamed protein product [Rotaria sp. Silwood1]CAF1097732.1 unnamed protein product [Rotaria sp. Silwood1]CAF4851993.1 unnamed protein product [Rotaria sp. Silwood1]CAF4921893.1 unnamed protein product [Rotaria sp. Silwood1]